MKNSSIVAGEPSWGLLSILQSNLFCQIKTTLSVNLSSLNALVAENRLGGLEPVLASHTCSSSVPELVGRPGLRDLLVSFLG